MRFLLDLFEAGAPSGETARLLYGIGVAVAVPFGWSWLARAIEQIACRLPAECQRLIETVGRVACG